MDIHKVLGENIKALRHQSELTIEKLSHDAGIAFSTLSLIERGQGNPTIEMLEKISIVLNVPVHKLLEPNNVRYIDPSHTFRQFIHQDQINKLPLKQRRKIVNVMGIILSLIESADGCEENDGNDSDM